MEIIGQPLTFWTVIIFTMGIGGLTLLTWLSFETEKIDEETGRVIRDNKSEDSSEATETSES